MNLVILSLSTNGYYLNTHLHDLKGELHRLNISLHSLDKKLYKYITGIDALDKVLSNIEKAAHV